MAHEELRRGLECSTMKDDGAHVWLALSRPEPTERAELERDSVVVMAAEE